VKIKKPINKTHFSLGFIIIKALSCTSEKRLTKVVALNLPYMNL